MDAAGRDRHPLIPDVSDTPSRPTRATDTPEARTRRAWWIFATSFFILGLIAVLRIGTERSRPADWAIVGLVLVVGFAAIRHRQAVTALEVGRREEAESFARILSSLSRSVSPDAILGAIVDELATATGADHIVVARRRPDARVLEATLVSARPGVPDSTTRLPIADLEDPVDGRRPGDREPVAIPITASHARDRSPAGSLRGRFDDVTARLARRRAGQRLVGLDRSRRADPGVAPGDRRPDRDADPPGLRSEQHAGRAADRGRRRHRGDHPVLPHGRRLAGYDPPPAVRRGGRGVVGACRGPTRSGRPRRNASTDALTGLPNRRYFDEFCGLLARRRRSGDAVGVLMIDIDKFKALNDTHGHGTGDEVLRAVGGAIVAAVREDDVPARYGGEEFVVLLRNPTPAVALEVGERVRTSVGGARPATVRRAGRQRLGRRGGRRPGRPADRRPRRAGRSRPVSSQARRARSGRRRLTGYHRADD